LHGSEESGLAKLSEILHVNSNTAFVAGGRARAESYQKDQKVCVLDTVVWIYVSIKTVVQQQHTVRMRKSEQKKECHTVLRLRKTVSLGTRASSMLYMHSSHRKLEKNLVRQVDPETASKYGKPEPM